jgi:hypothetical protein
VTVQIAHLYATGCLAIVFFQIALIAGAPLGRYTQGGRHPGALPVSGRIIAAVSIPVLVFMALAILSAAGFPGLNWPRWTGWVAFGVQCVSTVLNLITPSRAEREVWGPIMGVMSAMVLVVMTA